MTEKSIFFNNSLVRDTLSLQDWESLLGSGWDRIGFHFFRKQFQQFTGFDENLNFRQYAHQVMPLRFRLDETFQFSKSQLAIKKRNADLRVVFKKAKITREKLELFHRWHQNRFGYLTHIEQWLHTDTHQPFPCMECALYDGKNLVACSYFDKTNHFTYSTIAFYEPHFAKRSLGIFTLICEIEYAIAHKKTHHYPGHAFFEKSMYDYKKRFANLEFFDWKMVDWSRTYK